MYARLRNFHHFTNALILRRYTYLTLTYALSEPTSVSLLHMAARLLFGLLPIVLAARYVFLHSTEA
jgi:hypothetical protein